MAKEMFDCTSVGKNTPEIDMPQPGMMDITHNLALVFYFTCLLGLAYLGILFHLHHHWEKLQQGE
jgi:hypothetical protein